jgi:hypothetical protein
MTRRSSWPFLNICARRACRAAGAGGSIGEVGAERGQRLFAAREFEAQVCSTHSVSAINCSWRSLLSIWRACQGSHSRTAGTAAPAGPAPASARAALDGAGQGEWVFMG